MSERMIELQRARMLAQSSRSPAAAAGGANSKHVTPQRQAVAACRSEDDQLRLFLTRMQRRDDGWQHGAASASNNDVGPTCPTALSRRLLHRQGVGFVDDTLPSIASAAADRFLATVLHQAVACRDQRLKGAELWNAARTHRRKHVQQYQIDSDARKRRRLDAEAQREAKNLKAIAMAADITKTSKKSSAAASKGGDDGKPTKKKKKVSVEDDGATRGGSSSNNPQQKSSQQQQDDDEDASHDSVDEEEEFYQSYYSDDLHGPAVEEEEDDETLQLADISRPLQSWDFYLAGKQEIKRETADSKDEDDDPDDANNKMVEESAGNNNAASAAAGDAKEPDGGDAAAAAANGGAPNPEGLTSPARPTPSAAATPTQG